MTYIKDGGNIYKVGEVRNKIDLQELKDELARLQAVTEPDDNELIKFAKSWHEFYSPTRLTKIADLQKLITQLEKL